MFYEKYFNTRKYNFFIYFPTIAFFFCFRSFSLKCFWFPNLQIFFFLKEIIGSFSVMTAGGLRLETISAKIKTRVEPGGQRVLADINTGLR